jgi:hypothetical protein
LVLFAVFEVRSFGRISGCTVNGWMRGLDTQDVELTSFETSFAADEWGFCDDSPTADPPDENSDPNETHLCGC